MCINLTAKQESNNMASGFSKQSETRTEQKHFFSPGMVLIKFKKKKKGNIFNIFSIFLLEYDILLEFLKFKTEINFYFLMG